MCQHRSIASLLLPSISVACTTPNRLIFPHNFTKTTTFDHSSPMSSSHSRSVSSSSNSSFDEDYFFQTYVPLSNLPTPPLSFLSNDSSRQQSPNLFPAEKQLDPKFLGPAIHLTNLIPSSTTLISPSVPLAHAILTRAALPLETIALAVCILDSLNSRFALSWRRAFPLSPASASLHTQTPHIDTTRPELIILSALILAVKFIDDIQEPTNTYAADWGSGTWTLSQINYTQRLILENLSYRLLPLWNETFIAEAMEDMERARRQSDRAAERKLKIKEKLELNLYPAEPRIWDSDWDVESCCGGYVGRVVGGEAVVGLGEQLTPVVTPMEENVKDKRDAGSDTRRAFLGLGEECRTEEILLLPDRISEPLPHYVDPLIVGMGF